jgi:hypothetical protein
MRNEKLDFFSALGFVRPDRGARCRIDRLKARRLQNHRDQRPITRWNLARNEDVHFGGERKSSSPSGEGSVPLVEIRYPTSDDDDVIQVGAKLPENPLKRVLERLAPSHIVVAALPSIPRIFHHATARAQ